MSKSIKYLLWVPVALAVFPFVGPVAVAFMICSRWYWSLFAPILHRRSLSGHFAYMVLGPLAMVGALVFSAWLPTILTLRGFEVWPWLMSLDPAWNAYAMPMASKILGLITGAHDAIASVFSVDGKWLPTSWWAIARAGDAKAIFHIMNNSWATFVPLLAFVYVLLSYFYHVTALFGMDSRLKQQKIDAINRMRAQIHQADIDAKEKVRIQAGGIPRMANGQSSALEF